MLNLTRLCVVPSLAGLVALGCSASAQVSTESPEPAPTAAAPAAAPAEDPEDVRIEGDHLVIDRMIHFAHDSDEILDDSTDLLDHIAQLLKKHTEVKTLHVIGHTDSSGDDDHNQELSQKRAAAVVAALTSRGVGQKMDSKGMGEKAPACSEDTPECHEKNRRVEFIVETTEASGG